MLLADSTGAVESSAGIEEVLTAVPELTLAQEIVVALRFRARVKAGARAEELRLAAAAFEASTPEGEQLREWLAGIAARAAANVAAAEAAQ